MKKLLSNIRLGIACLLLLNFSCTQNKQSNKQCIQHPNSISEEIVIDTTCLSLPEKDISDEKNKNIIENIDIIKPIEIYNSVDTFLCVVREDTSILSVDSCLNGDIVYLTQILEYYETNSFETCISAEQSVKDFTNRFFNVIEKINVNDTVMIEKLTALEHFLTVFEEDFEEIEQACPDLYNDYMEFLDDLIDIHYQKLEMIFGQDYDLNHN